MSEGLVAIDLPAVADLHALEDVREQITAQLDSAQFAIGLKDVQRISTNALLMLLSAARTTAQAGGEMKLVGPSEQVSAAIETLGLGEAFAPLLEQEG
jgi:anti-anti-sigma factor